MFISVVICTRNRCDKLVNVLRSLETLNASDGLQWEVLIVDNGSTDSTAEVCMPFVKGSSGNYRYLYEGKKGKSHALNNGISEARGDILAFTDDDCIVDRTWLAAIAREYSMDPELAVLGGRVELYNKHDKPKSIITFTEQINLSASLEMLLTPTIIGANVSYRKDVISSIGEFDVRLGPGSGLGASCEDTDYLYRAYRKGFKIIYFPNVIVYHDHGRRSEAEIDALDYRYMVGRRAFYCKHALGDIEIARRMFWDLKWQVRHLRWRTLGAYAIGAMSRIW
jgi:glycosyltransferase involved in cell wall biosynthesis